MSSEEVRTYALIPALLHILRSLPSSWVMPFLIPPIYLIAQCSIGADVIHPPPGAQGRPSFASLVSSVDSACIKYIAKMSVQKARQEHIEAMEQMATVSSSFAQIFSLIFSLQAHLTMHVAYKKNVEKVADGRPRRILFYRDGVSEGQFAHVRLGMYILIIFW